MKPVQLARLHTRDIFSFRCRVSIHVSTLLYTCPSVYSTRVYSPRVHFSSVHSTRVLFTRVQVREGGVAGAAAAGGLDPARAVAHAGAGHLRRGG